MNNIQVENLEEISEYIDEYNKTINDMKLTSNSYFQIYTYIFITIVIIFLIYARSYSMLYYTRGSNSILYYFIFICIIIFIISLIFSFLIRKIYNNNFENLGTLVSTISKETCINYPDIKIPNNIDNQTLNPNTNSNIPLFIRDYYFIGCNKPYINKNLNGRYYESIYILKKNLDLGFRLISLEINMNSDNKLVIGKSLDIDKVFNIINQKIIDKKYNLPFLIYFKFNFKTNLYYLTQDLHDSIMKSFGDNLLGNSYAYIGNNNNNPIENIPISISKNKVIIISDIYPTQNQNLDFLINATISKENQTINLISYNQSMADQGIIKGKPIVDVVGFVKTNKTNISLLEPINETIEMRLDDCIQLGIQFYLINMSNFEIKTSNKTNYYLKQYLTFNNNDININNNLISLKPAFLRYFPNKVFIPKPQNKNLSLGPNSLSNYMNGFIPSDITF
jgi:hypothetical protein